jgi:hypothetical protein
MTWLATLTLKMQGGRVVVDVDRSIGATADCTITGALNGRLFRLAVALKLPRACTDIDEQRGAIVKGGRRE